MAPSLNAVPLLSGCLRPRPPRRRSSRSAGTIARRSARTWTSRSGFIACIATDGSPTGSPTSRTLSAGPRRLEDSRSLRSQRTRWRRGCPQVFARHFRMVATLDTARWACSVPPHLAAFDGLGPLLRAHRACRGHDGRVDGSAQPPQLWRAPRRLRALERGQLFFAVLLNDLAFRRYHRGRTWRSSSWPRSARTSDTGSSTPGGDASARGRCGREAAGPGDRSSGADSGHETRRACEAGEPLRRRPAEQAPVRSDRSSVHVRPRSRGESRTIDGSARAPRARVRTAPGRPSGDLPSHTPASRAAAPSPRRSGRRGRDPPAVSRTSGPEVQVAVRDVERDHPGGTEHSPGTAREAPRVSRWTGMVSPVSASRAKETSSVSRAAASVSRASPRTTSAATPRPRLGQVAEQPVVLRDPLHQQVDLEGSSARRARRSASSDPAPRPTMPTRFGRASGGKEERAGRWGCPASSSRAARARAPALPWPRRRADTPWIVVP